MEIKKVVIEGPDGAGKSTLVEYLMKKYNAVMSHSSSETANDLNYHMTLLDNDWAVVYDRFNMGEIVYPSVYGRKRKLNPEEQEIIMKTCETRHIPYIIFYSSDFNILKERLFKRGDTEQVLKNAEDINEMFRACAAYFSRNYENVYALDIAKEKDQIKAAEDFFKRYEDKLNSKEEELER